MGSSNQDTGILTIIKWVTEQYKEVYEFKLFLISDGLTDIASILFLVILYRHTFQ